MADRVVTIKETKLPVLKFKNKKCPDCKKKYILDKEWGEGCWYCGAVITLRENESDLTDS